MAFDWSRVGSAPAADEFELSIFGPGFGECAIVHVGAGRWAIVDSCVDTTSQDDRLPVAERYLRTIGVNLAEQVDLILATHWHADHVRGIGRLVDQCPGAEFSCALSLVGEEFLIYAEEMATGAAATDGAKLTDFREAIRTIRSRNSVIRWATGGKLIRAWNLGLENRPRCEARALSPSDREYQLFLQEIAAARPTPTQPKRAASARTPNLASVVLQIQSEQVAVLLGADMEIHHDPTRGWTAAIAEGIRAAAPQATVVKIPHHGSATGHHEAIWTRLVAPQPIAVITPFNKLPDAQKLPTHDDLARMKELAGELYLTAPQVRSSSRGREAAVERGLRESRITLKDRAVQLGMVRARTRDGVTWATEVFPPAMRLRR